MQCLAVINLFNVFVCVNLLYRQVRQVERMYQLLHYKVYHYVRILSLLGSYFIIYCFSLADSFSSMRSEVTISFYKENEITVDNVLSLDSVQMNSSSVTVVAKPMIVIGSDAISCAFTEF